MGVWNRRYAESCEDMSGGLVRLMYTVSVARDFELVRQVRMNASSSLLCIIYRRGRRLVPIKGRKALL
jgi:hypothetical protein